MGHARPLHGSRWDRAAVGPVAYGFNTYTTIQDGINAVTNSTVYVAAGTYAESLTLNKPLKLIGAGSASTTINGAMTIDAAASGVSGDPTLIKGFDITATGNIINLGSGLQYADRGLQDRRWQ